ncbi:MAG: DUF1653 domain-containing protein [Eubacteriales bacterium]|nr:DUF1653 domain-containing protein [Eubacteriales bacterium]
MDRIPAAGEIYRHFKGDLYRVVTVAQHTETGEQLVIYQALSGDFRVYARPLSMFTGPVDREKYPRAKDRLRFTLIPEAGTLLSPGQEPCPATSKPEQPEKEGELALDPELLHFLEADSYERKLEIFSALAGRIDERMLNTMAVSLDLELSGGSLEEQYEELKNCLLTLERYECNRLR